MGTSCRILAVADPEDEAAAQGAVSAAVAEIRRLEGLLSTWIDGSEMSRLNAAPAGLPLEMSEESLTVLRASFEAYRETGGAFDITCKPLIELWREGAKENELPTTGAIEYTRELSQREHFEIRDSGVVKSQASARVDLGGVAKGYAIDRAIEVLQDAGLSGGLVDIGGDLRVFGKSPEGGSWPVQIRSPFTSEGVLATIAVTDAAVCTSGSYARFSEIEGQRYSHIIDPRTGMPADGLPSVTVVAPTAMRADIWATAISVLGNEGLEKLPEGFSARTVQGSALRMSGVTTPGFPPERN